MDWQKTKIEAVIFDMDGVLIDSEPLWKIAEEKVFRSIGIPLTKKDFEKTVGLRIDEVVQFWLNEFPENPSNPEVVTERIIREVAILIRMQGRPLEGCLEILNYLRRKGIPLAIGTSSYHHVIEAVLESLHIREFFTVIHSAEDEPCGKPHPGVYLTCAKKLGVLPTRCLVIEDSANGLLSAKAARMYTIVVPEKSHAPHPYFILADEVCSSLLEVKLLFERIELFDKSNPFKK
jgi:mannitol-1-/sugar-/sorbitol-6-/2-deoxyglucose-6-phosphatase